MKVRAMVFGTALLLAMTPAAARADGLITPFLGGSFGGRTVDAPRVTFGGALGFMGAGAFGFELDFGYSPEFFPEDHGDVQNVVGNLTTVMANVIVGAPIGGQSGPGLRPYLTGGVGVLRVRVEDPDDLFELRSNELGVSFGGGLLGFVSDNLGIRGDIRYFRNINDYEFDDEFDIDLQDFDFWRATVGVTFRF